jgi:hypothetical protein
MPYDGAHAVSVSAGERVYIYNLQSRLVYGIRTTDVAQTVPLSSPGLYIVTSGGQSVKVVYRQR